LEHLQRDVVELNAIHGIAHLRFDFLDLDEEVLDLAGGNRVFLSQLNPIQFAIKSASFDVLKYLVSRFGLRQATGGHRVSVVSHHSQEEFTYSNILLPLLVQSKDVDILGYVLKQTGLVITHQDFNSFVRQSLVENWTTGLRTFLHSNAVQFFFTSLLWDEQRYAIDRIIRDIQAVGDEKHRQALQVNIVEETLTKRPYSKHLAILLFEGKHNQGLDVTKIARECLKNLTSEDLF
jgi:hypothetical protein